MANRKFKKEPLSDVEYNHIRQERKKVRRAATLRKARRNRARPSSNTPDDYSTQQYALAIEALAQGNASYEQAYSLRMQQARLALQSPAMDWVVKGSIPHRVALLIIGQFTTTEPFEENGKLFNHVQVAIERMYTQLHPGEEREDSINLGISVARRALGQAFKRMQPAAW